VQVSTPGYLTPPVIARQLGVKSGKVIGWIKKGELFASNCAADRAGRPRWKVSRSSLNQFLEARGNRKPIKATRRRKSALTVQEFFP
jgi:hypothetical protein